jgi:hypothetical protein
MNMIIEIKRISQTASPCDFIRCLAKKKHPKRNQRSGVIPTCQLIQHYCLMPRYRLMQRCPLMLYCSLSQPAVLLQASQLF